MRIPNRQAAFAVLAVLVSDACAAYGQAIDLSLDLNTPASHTPRFSEEETLDVNAAPAFNLGFFSKRAFAEGPPLRMGIVLGRQRLSVKPGASGAAGTRYTAINVQGRGDLQLLGNQNWRLSGGLAAGLSFTTDSTPCNEIFCDLPESVVLVSPSVRTTFRLSPTVSGVIEARGSVYMTDRNSTYPFMSGVIAAFGIEFSAEGGGTGGSDF